MSKIEPIEGFKSEKFKDGTLLIKLIESIEPSVIKRDLITEGSTEKNKLMNGKYAISVAHKLGLSIFATPKDIVCEDIKDLNQDMILTFVCELYDLKQKNI